MISEDILEEVHFILFGGRWAETKDQPVNNLYIRLNHYCGLGIFCGLTDIHLN